MWRGKTGVGRVCREAALTSRGHRPGSGGAGGLRFRHIRDPSTVARRRRSSLGRRTKKRRDGSVLAAPSAPTRVTLPVTP